MPKRAFTRHKIFSWGGMFGLFLDRVFEALIPLYLRDGIANL